MAEGLRFEMKLSGVDGVLATLQSLPPEVVSKRGGPVKSALRKGALVIQKAEKQNLLAAIAVNGDQSTGLLAKNLIVSRGKAPTSGKGERYLVRVKRVAYRVLLKLKKGDAVGKVTTTLKTAQLMEYGSSHQNAIPWIRPAVLQHGQRAIETIERELVAAIDKVVKRLAAQNKGR